MTDIFLFLALLMFLGAIIWIWRKSEPYTSPFDKLNVYTDWDFKSGMIDTLVPKSYGIPAAIVQSELSTELNKENKRVCSDGKRLMIADTKSNGWQYFCYPDGM